jgi:hypothetical protein
LFFLLDERFKKQTKKINLKSLLLLYPLSSFSQKVKKVKKKKSLKEKNPCSSLFCLVLSFLLCVFLLLDKALGELTALTVDDGTSTDNTLMDSASDAHTGLHVELGESEALVIDSGGFSNIASGGSVEHVTDNKALNGLILGSEAAAVGAVSGGGTTTGVLGAAVISTLTSH